MIVLTSHLTINQWFAMTVRSPLVTVWSRTFAELHALALYERVALLAFIAAVLVLRDEQLAQRGTRTQQRLSLRVRLEALVALTHVQLLQVEQQGHYLADGCKAGRMAFVHSVCGQQRLVLHADLVEEARLDLQHRVSHGWELGALEELQDRAISHHTHPVRRENGAAQRRQQFQ